MRNTVFTQPVNGGHSEDRGSGLNFDLPIVYQVSGSASNGMDYTSLMGYATIPQGQASAEIIVEPLYDSVPGFDESVTLTLVLANGYVVDPKAAGATLKIYDARPSGMAVAIHDSGWTRGLGLFACVRRPSVVLVALAPTLWRIVA